MTRARIWGILKRAQTGPICPEREFTLTKYWTRLKELVKQYDIRYDGESAVPTDDTLLDDAFAAGMELLLDTGVLCINVERIIKLERNEIQETLSNLPGKGTLGEGEDAVTYRHLGLEDSGLPRVVGGPTGTPISEDMAVKIYESYAKEPVVDVLYLGFPVSVEGAEVRSGSPLELHAEIANIAHARIATRKVGRPGMPIFGSCLPSLAVDLGATSSEFGYKKTDLRIVGPKPQLKVDYDTLIRASFYMENGLKVYAWGSGNIGGISGGAETSAVTTIAECIASQVLFQPLLNWSGVTNISYVPWAGNSDKQNIWATSLATGALTRNTNMILSVGCYTYAGPCTPMCLQEIGTETIAACSVGAHAYGPAPNGGRILNHCTGHGIKIPRRGRSSCSGD